MTKRTLQLAVLATLLLTTAAAAYMPPGPPCTVAVVGSGGSLQLTPPNCNYQDPGSVALEHGAGFDPSLDWVKASHSDFLNVIIDPGGVLGGTVDTFDSSLEITVVGSNELEGFERTITVSAQCEAHAGPWDQNEPVISFPTEMMRIEGTLQGDEDFELVRIVGGSANGFPSPGQVTAVDQGDGTYVVDSMFNISFQIEYVGAPGGALDGLAGFVEGTATMKAFASNSQAP